MSFLRVENVSARFGSSYALRGVSFSLEKGESLGIIGESGCGKSTTASVIASLSSAEVSGTIIRPKRVGIIFQDPMSALNPTMRIGHQITEGFLYHKMGSSKEAKEKALNLLHLLGIDDPMRRFDQYPHNLSGGQRQRVLIAIALIMQPELLIADEPTTALDPATRGKIISLLKEMQQKHSMGLLLISHDFSTIATACDKVLVMYAGKIVESATTEQILRSARHPYTQMLLSASPENKKRNEPLTVIEGSPPSPLSPITGCAFKPRCPFAALQCEREPIGSVACWREIP